MRPRSKRYRKEVEGAPKKALPLDEAIRAVKAFGRPKFDQSVDITLAGAAGAIGQVLASLYLRSFHFRDNIRKRR